MNKNHSFSELRKELMSAQKICIAGHVDPDGDAVGAACALALALRDAGKEVSVLIAELPEKYEMPGLSEIVRFQDYDELDAGLFVAVDCASEDRLGEARSVFMRTEKTMNIDHHGSNDFYAQKNYVDEYAAAACEIIFELLDGFLPITQNVAQALYTGLLYDTGGFRHASTRPQTLRAAAALMETGINFSGIYNRIFYEQNFSETQAVGVCIKNAKRYLNGEFIFTKISLKEIDECKTSPKELDGISEYMKRNKGCRVSAFARAKNSRQTKISFRASGVDVCAIATHFGGGGHVNAAGCTLDYPLEEAEKIIVDYVVEHMSKC